MGIICPRQKSNKDILLNQFMDILKISELKIYLMRLQRIYSVHFMIYFHLSEILTKKAVFGINEVSFSQVEYFPKTFYELRLLQHLLVNPQCKILVASVNWWY